MRRATGFPAMHRMARVLFAALALSTPVLAQSGAVIVSVPTLFDIGGAHVSIAAGDLDGDGALDLAAADPEGRAITVLFGDGNGGHRDRVSHPLTDRPFAVALADLDRDGALDLVVAFSETGRLAVLRGEGSGSLTAPSIIEVGGSPQALAAGDFNGDGSADVAALDRSGARIALLPGDGTGSFLAPAFVAVRADTIGFASGDVDGDGVLDLITADGAANAISILRGDCTGFSNASVIAADNPRAIATTDLNGDGRLDLAVASGAGTAVAIMFGDGAGGFGSPIGIEIGAEAIAVAAGDLNRDGSADLAAVLADGALAIVLNLTPQASSNSEESEDSTTSNASAPVIAHAHVPCHYTWIHSSGSRNWNEPTNWSPWGPPGPADTACIPGPPPGESPEPLFVTVPTTVGTLVLEQGAALELRTRLELALGGDFSDGGITICGNPVGELAVAPGAVLHLHGSRIETINNPNVPCSDTTRVVVPSDATVRNESGDSMLVGRIDFAGRAEAASGKLTFRSHLSFPIASRWGAATLDASEGATIELAGMEIMGVGSRKTGAGLLDITGDQRGNLTIDGPSRLAPSPAPGIQGGKLTGGSTVVSNIGSIDIFGVNVILAHTLVVNGTAALQLQNGDLCLSTATLEVNGTLEIRAPVGAVGTCGLSGSGIVRVQPGGTLRKPAGSTGRVQFLSGVVLINNGSVVVDGGHLWLQESSSPSSGVYTLAAGTLIEQVAGNWHLIGSVQGEGLARLSGGQIVGSGQASVQNLHLAFGGLQGALRITGTMTFEDGVIAASLQIQPGATLNVPPNPRNKQLTGSLVVFGTVLIDQEFCAPGSTFVQGGGLLHFRQAVLGRCGGTGQIIINPNGRLQSDQSSDPLRQILWHPTSVFGRVAVTSGKLRIFETNQWQGGSELEISGGAIASIETFNSDRVQNFGLNARVTGGGVLDVNGMITGRPTFFSTVNLRDFAVFDGAAQADVWGPLNIFNGRLQNGYVLNVLDNGNLFSTLFSPCGGQVRVGRGTLSLRVPGAVMPCSFGQGSLVVAAGATLAGAVNPGEQIDLSLPLTNQGTVVAASGRLRFFGSNLSNDDGGTITGGTWIANANTVLGPFGGVSTNAASITLDGPGATFAFSNSGLSRNAPGGRLTLQNGATLNTSNFMDFTNEGTLVIGAGTFDAPTFVQRGSGATSLVHDAAALTTRSGMPSIEGGLLEGIGIARPGLRNAGGIVRPGLGETPGVLHVDGNYIETAEGTLKMFLRSATEHSVLHVTGTATFGGTLHMDPWTRIDSIGDPIIMYFPMAGDTYNLATYGARVDTHAQVENLYFTEFNHFFKRRYEPTVLTATVEPRMITDEVTIDPAEGPAQTHVIASFADNEFGRTDPAEFAAFVGWSDMADAAEATIRFDAALERFVVETTRGFLESGPVDFFFQISSLGPDGQGFGNSFTVDVRNLPPAVTPAANRSVAPGAEVTFDVASFADPGVLDTHGAIIDWGDGSFAPGIVTEANGSGTVAGTHTYQAGGPYTVTVTITDDDGAPASASFQVESGISIESLAPASGPKGGGAFTLIVGGDGFMPGTQLLWNGAERPTTVLNSSMLHAQIPASDLAIDDEIGVALVTARLAGGVQSNALAFTIIGSLVEGADTAVAADGDVAQVSAPGIAATLHTSEGSGPVSVTAARYDDNPTGVNALNAGGAYFDLLVRGNASGATLMAHLYYAPTIVGRAEDDLALLYFTGTQWQPVLGSGGTPPAKSTADNLDGTTSGGRFAVTFDATSTPPITALTGTVFAIGALDTTSPTCTASASPGTLWPPNNKFVPVTLSAQVADSGSGPAGYQLVSVTTSEGHASNETRGFAQGTPDTAGELRAARFGSGPGRVYTLTYRATDHAGNTATCTAMVTVPHDQRKQ